MAFIAGMLFVLLVIVYIERTLILRTIHQELRNIEADISHESLVAATAVRFAVQRLKDIL